MSAELGHGGVEDSAPAFGVEVVPGEAGHCATFRTVS
jgi:hypothetical protein